MSNLKGKSAAFATFPLHLQLQLVFLKVFIANYAVVADPISRLVLFVFI